MSESPSQKKDYVTISLQECYDKYKSLKCGNFAMKKAKKSSENSFEDIKSILSEFNVEILPKPDDKSAAKLWTKEWKRIQAQYSTMISKIHIRSFPGGFFDSRSYSTFARIQVENEAEDPTIEVNSVSNRILYFCIDQYVVSKYLL